MHSSSKMLGYDQTPSSSNVKKSNQSLQSSKSRGKNIRSNNSGSIHGLSDNQLGMNGAHKRSFILDNNRNGRKNFPSFGDNLMNQRDAVLMARKQTVQHDFNHLSDINAMIKIEYLESEMRNLIERNNELSKIAKFYQVNVRRIVDRLEQDTQNYDLPGSMKSLFTNQRKTSTTYLKSPYTQKEANTDYEVKVHNPFTSDIVQIETHTIDDEHLEHQRNAHLRAKELGSIEEEDGQYQESILGGDQSHHDAPMTRTNDAASESSKLQDNGWTNHEVLIKRLDFMVNKLFQILQHAGSAAAMRRASYLDDALHHLNYTQSHLVPSSSNKGMGSRSRGQLYQRGHHHSISISGGLNFFKRSHTPLEIDKGSKPLRKFSNNPNSTPPSAGVQGPSSSKVRFNSSLIINGGGTGSASGFQVQNSSGVPGHQNLPSGSMIVPTSNDSQINEDRGGPVSGGEYIHYPQTEISRGDEIPEDDSLTKDHLANQRSDYKMRRQQMAEQAAMQPGLHRNTQHTRSQQFFQTAIFGQGPKATMDLGTMRDHYPQDNFMSFVRSSHTPVNHSRVDYAGLDLTVASNQMHHTSLSPSNTNEPAKWVPNESSNSCQICTKQFSIIFNRKHHCRSCGILVCSSCSPDKDYVAGYKDKKVRICKQCAAARIKRFKEMRKLKAFTSAKTIKKPKNI